jgi:CheY-like chemotaxis protein/anti-sigma regulatory factor (Ser/Thr protein kinase)
LMAFPMRIRQVVVNLIGNAIKFTDRGGVTVTVRYSPDGDRGWIEIRDTGVGISRSKFENLFDAFEQADSSTTREFGGTGLGLAISKRVALLLGGDCTVESTVGVGSTFTFSFRAARAPRSRLVTVEGEALIAQRPEPPLIAEGPLDARILLAEDGLDNQRLISLILRKAGVAVVENGRRAVERASSEEFDVILMDMAMPEMDGYSATRTLRELGVETPIIALTAHALSGEREKCLSAGCTDYMTKPVDRLQLIRTLREHATRTEKKPE